MTGANKSIDMRKRSFRNAVLMFSAATVVVGAHGQTSIFNPEDRLYEQYKDSDCAPEILEWTNTEDPSNEIDSINDTSLSVVDDIYKFNPKIKPYKASLKYEQSHLVCVASRYLALLNKKKLQDNS